MLATLRHCRCDAAVDYCYDEDFQLTINIVVSRTFATRRGGRDRKTATKAPFTYSEIDREDKTQSSDL